MSTALLVLVGVLGGWPPPAGFCLSGNCAAQVVSSPDLQRCIGPNCLAERVPCPNGGCEAEYARCGSSNCGEPGLGARCPTTACFTASAAGRDDWSSWLPAYGDSGISWRFRVNTYGSDILPDCDFEFRNYGGGSASFRYSVAFRPREYGPSEEAGVQYGITLDYAGGDNVNNCTHISSITVSSVARR